MSDVERRELEALDERVAQCRVVPAPSRPGRRQYQRVEKPCQTLRERLALNENWMAISTGTIDQTM